ncbi:glycosyltransferase [Desulfomonile tiedjei]|uniref:glycosyltransferase n=1 Tax=Desulfomonile tiedjei TaxID=2358 RepID=UPI0002E60C45|nr:glycosyltransferase [Desulfomonile tiedjei]
MFFEPEVIKLVSYESVILAITAGCLGLIATLVLIPVLKKSAFKHQILSYPGGRRNHEKPTPLLGGVAIYIPFTVAFFVFYFLEVSGRLPFGKVASSQMLSLFLGATTIHILGTYDDIIGLHWTRKLAGQFCAVGILLLGGHTITTATIPFVGLVNFGWLGGPVFLVSILAIVNGINLIDGLDGLAGGICFFAAITSGIIGLFKGDLFVASIAFTISGSLLGFLCHNFPPASIYLGDGGSLMLGFVLGTLATSSAAISPGQRSGTMGMILIPFLPFGIALLDVLLAIIRRWVTGRRIFLADSDHLHHRLMEKFGEPRKVAAIIYFFSALLAAMTLVLVLGPRSMWSVSFILGSGMILLFVVVSMLRLYRIETLSKTIENRPHFQFLSSYHSFMSRRIHRARSFEELISLLESGVRDLGCDFVEVYYGQNTVRKWMVQQKLHEGAPRTEAERTFHGVRFHVRWAFPIHESETYHKYLLLTWYRVLNELEERLQSFSDGSQLYEWLTEQRYVRSILSSQQAEFSNHVQNSAIQDYLVHSPVPFYVVTVNHNNFEELRRLIVSLEPFKYLKKLIIVNHSSPESVGNPVASFPIQIIHQENKGYGAGLNRGLEEISEPNAITLLCNPDVTIINPEAMLEAIEYLTQNPEVSCLIPTLVDPRFRPTYSCRKFYTLKTLIASRMPWFKNRPPEFLKQHLYIDRNRSDPFEIDWGCGAAMLFRNSLFPHPLSFDERFFLYFEDVDLCTKAWQAGFSVVFFPKLVCLHDEQKRSHSQMSFFITHLVSMFKYMNKYSGLPRREHLTDRSRN